MKNDHQIKALPTHINMSGYKRDLATWSVKDALSVLTGGACFCGVMSLGPVLSAPHIALPAAFLAANIGANTFSYMTRGAILRAYYSHALSQINLSSINFIAQTNKRIEAGTRVSEDEICMISAMPEHILKYATSRLYASVKSIRKYMDIPEEDRTIIEALKTSPYADQANPLQPKQKHTDFAFSGFANSIHNLFTNKTREALVASLPDEIPNISPLPYQEYQRALSEMEEECRKVTKGLEAIRSFLP